MGKYYQKNILIETQEWAGASLYMGICHYLNFLLSTYFYQKQLEKLHLLIVNMFIKMTVWTTSSFKCENVYKNDILPTVFTVCVQQYEKSRDQLTSCFPHLKHSCTRAVFILGNAGVLPTLLYEKHQT